MMAGFSVAGAVEIEWRWVEVIGVYLTHNGVTAVTEYERWHNASSSKNPWWVIIMINGRVVR